MIDMYAKHGLTAEQEDRLLKDAENLSRNSGSESVQIHWHSEKWPCEPKFEHAIYKEGFRRNQGSGMTT
jgi:hypothetical protein